MGYTQIATRQQRLRAKLAILQLSQRVNISNREFLHLDSGEYQMRLQSSHFTISEIRDMLERKDLVVNREYQRGARLWPAGPRSYFIDTILRGFPFPKMYFYEFLDKNLKKTKREIVDGQQRVTTIVDFIKEKFALTSVSNEYGGNKFSDLSEDDQVRFLSSSVPVDMILNAERADILEMFRRMNAYTLPLNDAEKRHSTFQGEFKWFINTVSDHYYTFFSEFGIFTNRQIVRMADAELIAEVVLAMESGIVSSNNTVLNRLYKNYDREFHEKEEYKEKINEVFEFIIARFNLLRKSYLMKPYVIHSLCCALLHNKYGLPGAELALNLPATGEFIRDFDTALRGLEALSAAHESKELEGEFAEYVWGCMAGTNREPRRIARTKNLCLALNGELLGE